MDIEDDFIEDSSPEDPFIVKGEENEDENRGTEKGFFLTETEGKLFSHIDKSGASFDDDFITDSEAPKQEEEDNEADMILPNHDMPETIIIPTSDVQKEDPKSIAGVTRGLISAIKSLMMFGRSDIGTTINDPQENLCSLAKKICSEFLLFHSNLEKKNKDPEYILLKKLSSTKKFQKYKVNELQKTNNELKIRIRNNEKLFDSDKKLVDHNDIRVQSVALKNAINKLTQIHKDIRDIQKENMVLSQQINELLMKQSSRQGINVTNLHSNILNLEAEIQDIYKRNASSITKMEQSIESMAHPISLLESRVNDLEKRIKTISKPQKIVTKAVQKSKPDAAFIHSHLSRYMRF